MKIIIPDYKAKSRNQTATKHWTKYLKAKREIHELMLAYCKKPRSVEPAVVQIEAFYKGKRSVDTSNIDDKLIVDGLMLLGILTDDTPDKNPIIIKICHKEAGKDELVISVSKTHQEKKE